MEAAMANTCSSSRSSQKSLVIILAALLLVSPLAAFGESMMFTRTPEMNQENSSSLKDDSLDKVKLTLDDNGNAMVRYGGVSCTLIYGASSPQERKEHPALASSDSQVASLCNICLKIGITF
jgi:hypothetical protein